MPGRILNVVVFPLSDVVHEVAKPSVHARFVVAHEQVVVEREDPQSRT